MLFVSRMTCSSASTPEHIPLPPRPLSPDMTPPHTAITTSSPPPIITSTPHTDEDEQPYEFTVPNFRYVRVCASFYTHDVFPPTTYTMCVCISRCACSNVSAMCRCMSYQHVLVPYEVSSSTPHRTMHMRERTNRARERDNRSIQQHAIRSRCFLLCRVCCVAWGAVVLCWQRAQGRVTQRRM